MLAKDSSKLWSWVEEAPDNRQEVTEDILSAAGRVVAVLVAHNGEAWLPRTLAHLERLEVHPGMLIGVDADSSDESRLMLETTGIFDLVVDGNQNLGFGENIKFGLSAAGIDEKLARAEFDWVWLLHDDLAVGRTSLTHLVAEAIGDERPDVLIPKLLMPRRRNHPDKIASLGESIAADGTRAPVVEPGELDQGQLEPVSVLGGCSAGMMISLKAWQKLDGFSPDLPLFRDGVEFGMRANRAKMKVLTCPDASMRHINATRNGLRNTKLTNDPKAFDIALGMMVAAGHSQNVSKASKKLTSIARLNWLGHLFSKSADGRNALKAAITKFNTEKPSVQRISEAAEKSGDFANIDKALFPARFWEMRQALDLLAGKVADKTAARSLRPEPEARGGLRTLASPGMITAAFLLVITIIASRFLLSSGKLTAPLLLQSPDSLGVAWRNWTHSVPGLFGANPPWLGLMAFGSTLTFGQPEWFATVLVLGGCLIAGACGYFFLRHLTKSRWQAAVLASLWGLALPLSGATGAGSLDAIAAAILLPLIANVCRVWLVNDKAGPQMWRRPAHFALLSTILISFVPLTWLVLALVAFLIGKRTKNWKAALIAALGPIVVLLPWLPRLFSDPGRLLTGSEPSAVWSSSAPNPLGLLAGRGEFASAPIAINVLVIAVFWVLALVAVYRLRSRLVLYLAGSAVAFLAVAILLSRLVVTVNYIPARPISFVWLFCYLGVLLMLAALGTDPIDIRMSRAELLHKPNFWLAAAAVFGVLLGSFWWAIAGSGPNLNRGNQQVPSYVQDTLRSERHTRALLVEADGSVAKYWLVDENGPTWGSGEKPAIGSRAANNQLSDLAKQIAQGMPSDDVYEQLTGLAISHIWVRGVSEEAIQEFSSSASLTPIDVDDNTTVFSMPSNVSRMMFKDGKVLLSEPKDSQWSAKAVGTRLTASDAGDWRQAWELSEKKNVEISASPSLFSMATQILGLLALGILGAPAAKEEKLPRRATETAKQSARRRAE